MIKKKISMNDEIIEELNRIFKLHERREIDFNYYIEIRDAYLEYIKKREKLVDSEDDYDELDEYKRLNCPKEPDCFESDSENDTEFFCIYDKDLNKLHDLLYEHLDYDDYIDLIHRAKDEGYIPWTGHDDDYDDEPDDDHKYMAAYLYCVENDIIPSCDFWTGEGEVRYY